MFPCALFWKNRFLFGHVYSWDYLLIYANGGCGWFDDDFKGYCHNWSPYRCLHQWWLRMVNGGRWWWNMGFIVKDVVDRGWGWLGMAQNGLQCSMIAGVTHQPWLPITFTTKQVPSNEMGSHLPACNHQVKPLRFRAGYFWDKLMGKEAG